MAQRRFGPTRGAGVTIIELEGDKGIEPGALGWAGYAGIFEKGPVGEMVLAPNKTTFEKKMGSYQAGSLAPDACYDYYDLAAGAGGIALIRITDGNELEAEALLYTRNASIRSAMGKLTAKNGGRWGGKEAYATGDLASAGDLTNITLDTGLSTWKNEQWVDGYIELDAVSNKQYKVTASDENGVLTVAADQTMLDDWTAAADPTNLRWYLFLENDGKALSYEIQDGQEKPTEEFGLYIYVDGVLTLSYPNLSTDPASARYWVDIINEDGNNDEVTAEDLWTGAHTAAARPANYYGLIDTGGITDTVLTAVIHEFNPASVGDGDGTLALGTTTDEMLDQKITITFSDATTFTAVSDKFGSLGAAGTVGSLFTPNNKWTPPFTLTAGGTAWEAADEATLVYKPFKPDAFIGGYVYPDKPNATRTKYRIVDNDHNSITAADGSDMTTDGAPGDEFMVVAPMEMAGGRDGNADVGDTEYKQQAWDTGSSPYNRLVGKNMGLVKFATPGITASAVQKAGVAYANAKNHQYRYEIPASTVTEQDADAYINDTIGRNDYAVVAFPSYGSVPDPLGGGEGKLKQVSLTGMIHGREARIAADWNGYHKAEAGIDAILPSVLKIPTGDAILDEEYLNPLGINVIKKVKGNFIIWGDRTLYLDPTWKWKHQREYMSYVEHVLQENFDWIVFAINDPVTEKMAHTALLTFFLPEYQKRALRGDSFDQAITIKIDAENNTNLTRSNGEMYAEIKMRIADTVERFIIKIGKMGIFESVG